MSLFVFRYVCDASVKAADWSQQRPTCIAPYKHMRLHVEPHQNAGSNRWANASKKFAWFARLRRRTLLIARIWAFRGIISLHNKSYLSENPTASAKSSQILPLSPNVEKSHYQFTFASNNWPQMKENGPWSHFALTTRADTSMFWRPPAVGISRCRNRPRGGKS